MGFSRIQTYILDSELGTTLLASGWTCEGPAGGGQWKHTDGRPRRTDQPTEGKMRWSKTFKSPFGGLIVMPETDAEETMPMGLAG